MVPNLLLTTLRSEAESERLQAAEPTFPFLSLPRELRDNIYEHVDAFVAEGSTRVLYKERMSRYVKEEERRAALARSSYAVLAHVCRQIRHEYLRVHRKHAYVSIRYGDLEHWFDNCKVDAENIWHVHHMHILVSQNDDMIRKEISILNLLQYQAHHFKTFDCDFQHLDEFDRYELWSSGTSSWCEDLAKSTLPWRHIRKRMADLNTLIALRDEGWLNVLREDPSSLKNVTLFVEGHLEINLESHSELDMAVVERLFRAFELERENYRHLPESRLSGPLVILKHAKSVQKIWLGQSGRTIRSFHEPTRS